MRPSKAWHIGSILVELGGIRSAAALPPHARSATTKTPNDLLPEYDFIVVGGGTTGLTIADRLTESGNYTVLVVEYGYLDDNPTILATGGDRDDLDPNDVARATATQSYNITTLPIEGLADQRVSVMAAAVVGGASAINGMMLDRGSAEDYDAWVKQAGPTFSEEYGKEWGWKNLLPWFMKSATFHPPSDELAAEYQITYDTSVWGNLTPLHASYSPFYWKMQKVMFNSFKQVPGVAFPKEGADGNATGVFWAPGTMSPADRHRSYSRTAHYDPVKSRPNYHLLAGWRVTQLTMESDKEPQEWTATGVLVTPRDGDMPESGPVSIKAKREIVVSAGTIHTPQVLQRSGIGPRDVIEAANGTVRVELPGVGSNLQDHMHFPMFYDCKWKIICKIKKQLTLVWRENAYIPRSVEFDHKPHIRCGSQSSLADK
jgi:choline dehydrogenase-like flavoprotein